MTYDKWHCPLLNGLAYSHSILEALVWSESLISALQEQLFVY